MITFDNYSQVEEELNKQLKSQPGFEDWMYFSVELLRGSDDKFTVGYLLPTSNGVNTNMTLDQALQIYGSVTKRVLS